LDNLKELDKFLKTYNLLSKTEHDEIKNMKRLIIRKETESFIKNLPTNKRPELDSFTDKFYRTFKELILILLKLFKKKKKKEETFPNLFYEASITLITK